VQAAELGDIDAGLQFAAQHCAGCHDIKTRNPMTTGSGVPTFATVANNSGITRTSLVVWMQTSHPDMPDLILEPQDLDNVIAYILSLRKS
jgi:mono/diheme cytochrome c family protein